MDVARSAPVAGVRRLDALAAPAAALAPAGILAVVAFADGGFDAAAWRWITLSFIALGAIALVMGMPGRPSRAQVTVAAAMAALAGWTALSILWSDDPSSTGLEWQRTLVYAAALAAAAVLVRRRTAPALLAGVLAAVVLVTGAALAARLVRDGSVQIVPTQGTLLVEPFGYSNAVAIFAVIGLLLALGFAAEAASPASRALAGAAAPVLAAALTMTESRGGWLALAAGLLVAVGLRPRLAVTALGLVPAIAAAVWLCERSALPLAGGQPNGEGGRLALALLGVALLAAALTSAVGRVPMRRPGPALAVLAPVIAVTGVLGLVLGGPQPNLGARTLYWQVALDQYAANPLLGSGAGTFARYWLLALPVDEVARDAHSVYLEVLAELGPIGLALLVLALAPPLLAGVRARNRPLVAAAAGAYAALLLHAALDWDWELPAVTLAGLLCGAALLAAAPEGQAHSRKG